MSSRRLHGLQGDGPSEVLSTESLWFELMMECCIVMEQCVVYNIGCCSG